MNRASIALLLASLCLPACLFTATSSSDDDDMGMSANNTTGPPLTNNSTAADMGGPNNTTGPDPGLCDSELLDPPDDPRQCGARLECGGEDCTMASSTLPSVCAPNGENFSCEELECTFEDLATRDDLCAALGGDGTICHVTNNIAFNGPTPGYCQTPCLEDADCIVQGPEDESVYCLRSEEFPEVPVYKYVGTLSGIADDEGTYQGGRCVPKCDNPSAGECPEDLPYCNPETKRCEEVELTCDSPRRCGPNEVCFDDECWRECEKGHRLYEQPPGRRTSRVLLRRQILPTRVHTGQEVPPQGRSGL